MKRWILRLRLYRVASWLYENYRLIVKPYTQGALVALWAQERLLLVAASYRRELSLPGGLIARGESPQRAAQRELLEEIGVEVNAAELGEPCVITEHSARGINTVWIFSIELTEQPELVVDCLEILSCVWLTRNEALDSIVTDHLRQYLEKVV